MPHIDVTIDKTGDREIHVNGVKGVSCKVFTAFLLVGKAIASDEETSEYYEESDVTREVTQNA
jgi:hypothetical protein